MYAWVTSLIRLKKIMGVIVGIRALGYRPCKLAYDVGLTYFHGPPANVPSPSGTPFFFFFLK